MDNPDAIRGADIYDVFFEESGAFGTPGLLEQTYIATVDTATAGVFKDRSYNCIWYIWRYGRWNL